MDIRMSVHAFIGVRTRQRVFCRATGVTGEKLGPVDAPRKQSTPSLALLCVWSMQLQAHSRTGPGEMSQRDVSAIDDGE